jgi:uncharacterized protein
MSLEKTAPEPIREMLQPLQDGSFSFACHPSVPCFTECCRELKLLLTPYDVVRLKNRLGLDSDDFLDQFGEIDLDEQRGLPMVHLKMEPNERKTCPFVSPQGCKVYEDRPAACRIYPIAKASRMHRTHGTVQENYFVLREPHCRGFEEQQSWTIEEWAGDQGLKPYKEINDLWMDLITHPKLRQQGTTLSEKQQQMFFTAAYCLDRFRKLITAGRFLELFNIPEEEQTAVKESDEALLKLSFKWLRFSLFNEKTMELRQQ